MKKFKAILFDLDGTLVDTAPDLAHVLNQLRIQEGKPLLPFSDIRSYASDGTRGLLQLSFGIEGNHPHFEILREKFLQLYASNINQYSVFFEGIENILSLLDKKKLPWGIVTNKYTHLTEKLLKELNIFDRTACIVCGDTLPECKPHPAPLIHAAKLLGVSPEACCYVGDHERDIQAAKAANMFSIAALYGYIHPETKPKLWQADAYIHSAQELLIKFVQKMWL
jgi:2-phosphoglycolate phosphatase